MKRDSKNSSGEKESTLNQLLVEMDGFESNEKVIVIAATNRPESLDPALKRPGRFDRLITMELPNFKVRVDILKMYLNKIRLDGAQNNEKKEEKETEKKNDFFTTLEEINKIYLKALDEYTKNNKENQKDENKKTDNTDNTTENNKKAEDIKKIIKKLNKKQKEHNVFFKKNFKKAKQLIFEDVKSFRNFFFDFFNLYGLKFSILDSKSIQNSIKKDELIKSLSLETGNIFINLESEIIKQSNRLAALSPGFSGADLKNLCNEAAILAAREDQEFVQSKDFEEASERVLGGLKKPDRLDENIRRTVAIHESGHAVSAWFLKNADPLVKVSIIPRTKGALGFAQYLVSENHIKTREELKDRVKFLLGGRIAEILYTGQASTGARDDLEKAFALLSRFVGEYGMSKK